MQAHNKTQLSESLAALEPYEDRHCIMAQLLRYESALVDEFGEVSDFAKRGSIWVFTGTCCITKGHRVRLSNLSTRAYN